MIPDPRPELFQPACSGLLKFQKRLLNAPIPRRAGIILKQVESGFRLLGSIGYSRMPRLGVVSFLNSKPLIAGLDLRPEVQLTFDVPAKLPELLISGGVDAALVPIVDVLRAPQPWSIVSDACIACDGETMTVRVFSQVPPDRITTFACGWRFAHVGRAGDRPVARTLWPDDSSGIRCTTQPESHDAEACC
jgi:hypothetical protein